MLPNELIEQIANNDATLKALDFSWQELDDADCLKLAAALTTNTHLQSLNLEGSRLTDQGIQTLVVGLQTHVGLQSLNLAHNRDIKTTGFLSLCDMLKQNVTLQSLNISFMDLNKSSETALLDALSRNLTLLRCDTNAEYLAQVQPYLDRNNKRYLNPKAPFNVNLMARMHQEEKPASYYIEKKGMIADILKAVLLQSLDVHIASEKVSHLPPMQRLSLLQLGRPENINTISRILEEYVYSFNDVAIEDLDHLLNENRDDTEADGFVAGGDFLNYLLDYDHEAFFNGTIPYLIQTMIPNISDSQLDKSIERFIEITYDMVVSNHQQGLIRKYSPQFSSSETPIPQGKKAIQTLLEDALRRAAANGDDASIDLLVHYVKDINAPGPYGMTAFDLAEISAAQTQDNYILEILTMHQGHASTHPMSDLDKKDVWTSLQIKNIPALQIVDVEQESDEELESILLIKLTFPLLNIIQNLYTTLFGFAQNHQQYFDTAQSEIADGIARLVKSIAVNDRTHLLSLADNQRLTYLMQEYETQVKSMALSVLQNTYPEAHQMQIEDSAAAFMAQMVGHAPRPQQRGGFEQKISAEQDQALVKKEQDLLLKVWLKEYRVKAIPSDSPTRQKLFDKALINAMEAGNPRDVKAIIPLVSNINAVNGPLQRTALHHAVIYFNKTGDQSGFDALRRAGADLTVMDKKGNSPADLWDLAKRPNPEILAALVSVQMHLGVSNR